VVAWASHYYAGKAAPGTHLAGEDVGGLTAGQLTERAAAILAQFNATLTQNGQSVQASAADLGLTADPAAAAAAALAAADGQPLLQRLNPWLAKDVALNGRIDQAALRDFLDQAFIPPDEVTQDASVAFDPATSQFTVRPSRTGLRTQIRPAVKMIEAYLADAAGSTSIGLTVEPNPPLVTDQAAANAASQAEQDLSRLIIFDNGQTGYKSRTYQLPADMIGNWTRFQANPATGELDISYDTELITEQLSALLAEKVTISPRQQIEVLVPGSTKLIGISQWGLNGLKLADLASVTEQVNNALVAGQDATIQVPLETDEFETETVEPPSNYDEPDGAKWIDVNRTAFTATLYQGTTEVATYTMSIGKPSTPTPTGEYYVYLKYEHQIMRGPASDPYESPTDWISYFNGGVAFHSAPWNEPNGWQQAVSHGCVNMRTAEAKIVYDFAPIGTKVVVHD
jgi:hypothetical protein